LNDRLRLSISSVRSILIADEFFLFFHHHQDKPTKITSQAAGYLLNWPDCWPWPAFWSSLHGTVKLLSSSSPVFFFLPADSQALESPVLARVSCRRQLSERRVFPGEKVNVKLQVANRKPLPSPGFR